MLSLIERAKELLRSSCRICDVVKQTSFLCKKVHQIVGIERTLELNNMWFQTAIAYIKKYWGIAALVLTAIFGFFLFRKQSTDFVDNLKKIQDAHDEELKQIQEARDAEEKQHLENEKKLQAALETVQTHYDDAKKDLDSKKKKEIEDLIKQYGDNPDVLAKKLSEATGFIIVLPDP